MNIDDIIREAEAHLAPIDHQLDRLGRAAEYLDDDDNDDLVAMNSGYFLNMVEIASRDLYHEGCGLKGLLGILRGEDQPVIGDQDGEVDADVDVSPATITPEPATAPQGAIVPPVASPTRKAPRDAVEAPTANPGAPKPDATGKYDLKAVAAFMEGFGKTPPEGEKPVEAVEDPIVAFVRDFGPAGVERHEVEARYGDSARNLRRYPFDNHELRRIRAMKGRDQGEVAELWNVSRATIYNVWEGRGIYYTFTEDDACEARGMMARGMKPREVAAKFKISKKLFDAGMVRFREKAA